MSLGEDAPKEDETHNDCVRMDVDGKNVFFYSYNCGNGRIGGILDDKGVYVPGKWEITLNEAAEEKSYQIVKLKPSDR